MDREKKLGEQKISKLLIEFSIPAITGMIVMSLYNIIDRIFIGNGIGSLGIAGITIGFPIMLLMFAFGMLIGIGATSLISIKLGEGKKDEAEKIMGNAVTMLIIISVLFAIVCLINLDFILKIFGASEEVIPYARDYMSVIILGVGFSSISFGMNNFIRAEGNPKIAMLTQLISAIINLILAPIFIFVFDWGMKGAGLATVIAQAISSIWIISYFLTGRSSLKIRMKYLKPKLNIVGKIVAIGAPSFSLQLAASLINVILNRSLTIYGGDLAISGMGIVNTIQTLLIMPVIGISQGAQPIIGYNYGAEKYDRVKATLKLAIIGATIVVVAGFIGTRLFPEQLIAVFNRNDSELIKFGSHALIIFFIFLPMTGFQIISSNYFQAIGKIKPAMILTMSRQIIILIPALFILPHFYGLNGVLYAGPLSDFLSSIITVTWLWFELKNLNCKVEVNAVCDY